MHPLSRLAIPSVLLSVSAVLLLGVFAGAVRAMPWVVDPSVPFAVIWPFARELARVGIDVALLIGIPIGTAVAVSVYVDRGEARALLALGQAPWRMAAFVAMPAGVGAVAGALVALAPHPESGRFARELLDRGRAACLEEPSVARAVQVPVVGVSWLCFPGRAPWVVGAAPGLGGRARFVASAITASDHLERLELSDVGLFVPPTASRFEIRLRAGSARVRGLVPWAAPAGSAGTSRAIAVALAEWLFALALAWQLIASGISGRALPILAGALGGGALLGLLRLVDRSADIDLLYPLFPVGAAALAWCLVLAVRMTRSLGPGVAGAPVR
jgi:hypothetical protein